MTAAAASRRIPGLAVVRITFREVFSRKLVVWGVGLSSVFLLLFGLGFWMLYRRAVQDSGPDAFVQSFAATILTTLGLYVVSFLAAFLALLVSVASVSGEIAGGTLQAVLARPLRRWSWLLQRWVAMVIVVGLYVAVMSAALLAVAGVIAGYRPLDALLTVLLMIAQAVAVLTLGMFASTRMTTLAAGVVGFSLFGLAWLGGIIEFIGDVVTNSGMVNTGVVVSLIMPSDVLWRGASFFAQSPSVLRQSAISGTGGLPFVSSAPPSALSLWWSAGWVVVLLALAVRRFSRRDL